MVLQHNNHFCESFVRNTASVTGAAERANSLPPKRILSSLGVLFTHRARISTHIYAEKERLFTRFDLHKSLPNLVREVEYYQLLNVLCWLCCQSSLIDEKYG